MKVNLNSFVNKTINIRSTFQSIYSNVPLVYYWDHSTNWGDSINSFVFQSILGKKVFSSNKVFNLSNREVVTGIGSILNSKLSNYSVWGSGFLSEGHGLRTSPNKVLAIRGKLTGKKIKDQFGIECEVFGDPGLLFREYYNPDQKLEYSIGIIPHFKEMNEPIIHSIKSRFASEINVIDPRIDIFEFANEVKKCERILSSSLHGLVLAESYGIPTIRIKISNKLIGGDFKFLDYYSGVSIKHFELCFLESFEIRDVIKISKKASIKDLNFNSVLLASVLREYEW
ncbi:polysaccharide pyruvyl transferase family protein [Algoriphagus limi]|uniref:Polysaccharide pyruvyl transferase family protein n=1 Tax=Algoriphagus limi TaxID=2975273 RepID=A0ABT2G175_9BACT|nr:polysaccharide pyruvyl transferase family protein [Algoriphagus limi]